MKNTMKNLRIRILGTIKRISRLVKVFFKVHKSFLKYSSIVVISLAIIVASIFIFSDVKIDLSFLKAPTPTATVAVTATPTAVATSTPLAHIYGNSQLIILDCSTFNDDGYIEQTASEFSIANDMQGSYTKVDESVFIKTYYEMVEAGNPPNVVIAPNHLIIQLGAFEDITDINKEVLFNSAAQGAVKEDKIPLALSMYGYFFRVDLLYVLSLDVPRLPQNIAKMAEKMRSDNVYDYLKYTEKNELKADRKDEFLTSRYGFGFPGGDVGGELFLQTAMDLAMKDGINFMYDVEYMWDEVHLPPDTVYARDASIVKAYMNDALCGVYAPAILFEELLNNPDLYYGTQVVPYLGSEPIYTANVTYCAIPEGSDVQVASNFLSILYHGGNVDKIITQNHIAYLPVSLFLTQNSHWTGAFSDDVQIIFYEGDPYTSALERIILADEDVESALAKYID